MLDFGKGAVVFVGMSAGVGVWVAMGMGMQGNMSRRVDMRMGLMRLAIMPMVMFVIGFKMNVELGSGDAAFF